MSKELAGLLWNARTGPEVDRIIDIANSQRTTAWRALGDRPNNIGTVGMSSQPDLAIVERVTNMFDAMLELGHSLNPDVAVSSPRGAARTYYGIPAEGLSEMAEPDRRSLAEKMVVSLESSGNPNRPSVVVQDEGIGETAERFPKTLLSLNESNKVEKPWTMGTYGQGGSVTFGFCEATVIVSRRHPAFLDGHEDRLAWTVVMKRYDPSKKLPNYEYLVDSNGQVMSLDPDLLPDLVHGTRIVHVEYDLQVSGPFTTNPYRFFNAALFEPVLPYLITGNRGKEAKYGSRVMIGNASRLRNVERARGDIEVAHTDIIKIDLGEGSGSVEARYWVLRRPANSKSRSDPTDAYVRAKEAISVTLHGQRHDAEERYWLRRNASLSFLFRNMIIQMDATDLTGEAKAEMFSSTRERGRTSEIRSRLYEALAYSLRNDPDLKYLNHEEKERLLQRSTAAANAKVRQRLGKFIKKKLKELSKAGRGSTPGTRQIAGVGGLGPKKKSGRPGKPRDTSDASLPSDPTYLRFSRKTVPIRQGERAHVNVELNAKNRYLPTHDDFLEIRIEGVEEGKIRVVSRSALMGGQCRWLIEADEDTPLGGCTLVAEFVCPAGVLTASLTLEVREKRGATETESTGGEPETGPEVLWVYQHQWADHGWDGTIVGEVHEDGDSTTILVKRK